MVFLARPREIHLAFRFLTNRFRVRLTYTRLGRSIETFPRSARTVPIIPKHTPCV